MELFQGDRSPLRPLFALADDSASEIERYLSLGEVLVARREGDVVGHVQVIDGEKSWEIKSIAVLEREQGRGIGLALMRAAIRRASSAGAVRVVVATGATDLQNLRFYQRLGFRIERVERDAFTAALGYPEEVRDRVWLDLLLDRKNGNDVVQVLADLHVAKGSAVDGLADGVED